MIRIRWETDYGLILLGHLVRRAPEGVVRTAREVSDWTGLPLPMVSKILKILARERILVSHRGVKGGYTLAQPPERTSVAQVIRALEGPIGITECASHPGTCDKEAGCPLRVNWVRISDAFRESLERIPLSEMYSVTPSPLVQIGDARSQPA